MDLELGPYIATFLTELASTISTMFGQVSPVFYLALGLPFGAFVAYLLIGFFSGERDARAAWGRADAVAQKTQALVDVDDMLDYDDPDIGHPWEGGRS